MKKKAKVSSPAATSQSLQQAVTDLINAGKTEEALKKIQVRLMFAPKDAWFLHEAARLYRRSEKLDEAERYYLRALAVDLHSPGSLNGLGLTYYDRKDFINAEKYYQMALSVLPSYAGCRNNYGIMLHKMDRYQEAAEQYQLALEADSNHPEARYGLSSVLAHLQQLEPAIEHMRHLLARSPQDARTQNSLGMVLMQQGNFEQGWPLYRGRYSKNNPLRFVHLPSINRPYWEGEDLTGKAILVHPEQGMGDEIQFCRFVSRLKQEKGASTVYLMCRPALYSLMQSLPDIDGILVLDRDNPVPLPEFDVWSLLLDLPRHFVNSQDPFALRPPYVFAPSQMAEQWRLPTGDSRRLRVGLVWKGSSQHANDRNRSLANLSALHPLWSVPGIEWISLQKGEGEDEAINAPAEFPILALGHQVTSYADTTAIIDRLDLVITVDTSVAHLAGAMNKPCWVMLPAFAIDWRWIKGQDTSPWYPSMRLFHHSNEKSWAEVIGRIRDALVQWHDQQTKA
ncbi:tetratricopeptide repeat-containing glycosyltransferase family protein [Jinshanibacter sp. LJY008]|uniref:Tetratricopeptide repeat-containing glycosyltransferase family protein n=1 Tax=Limnobaculum eriocheiris TaxID=2897391 RepID=A0A9X1MY09_9GAMM|nr:tetratricopeptide repeat-containing glycosyltransferase family protein [Limnobaculum eriocheiris]MCD1127049.1 tetratricopeptide repeat-containing glycosyltransferase family protein [Limnobaculum eriocheiris]